MSTNRVRERWSRGEVVVDCWLSGSSMTTAESIGRLGYDSVVIDMQHTLADFKDVAGCLIALTGTGTTAMVRVPGNDSSMIQKLLDAGAEGIMCPMINNPAEAQAFVGACRYPPLGVRSNGPFRTKEGGRAYFHTANDTVVTLAQIETREAMENLDAIAATPGLDALFVGPSDLSISYGGEPVMDYDNPVTAERHRQIVEAAHRAGKKAGMLALTPPDVPLAVEWGMDLISVGMDGMLVILGAVEALNRGLSETKQTSQSEIF
ncbi:MAG: putative aldolase [Frankiales bacterium]|nr:putative aldolase [Frankiales bacterium]